MPQVQCFQCHVNLPLRLSKLGERGAVWLCAQCGLPFVSLCIKEHLSESSSLVKLDDRYFDTRGLPAISPKLRREVARLAKQAGESSENDHRRSERVCQSLVAPAVCLSESFTPVGATFQLMVANISREGIGLVHNADINSDHLALKLPMGQESIQVVVRIVRQRQLDSPFREFGGEFFVRLG